MKKIKKFLSVLLSVLMVFSVVSVTSLAADSNGRLKGDMNGSGKIEAADARLLMRVSAGLSTLESFDIDFSLVDMNGDGAITAEDARRVLRYSAKIDMDFSDSEEIADVTPSLSIVCNSTNVLVDSMITLTVSADNMVGTKSNNLAIIYDPDCLEFVEIKNSQLFGALNVSGLFEDGVVHYASAFTDKATMSGALFNVSFKVLKGDNVSLSCSAESWVGTHIPKDVHIVLSPHTHTFETTFKSDASCVSDGIVTYTCTECGYDYRERIPKIDHVDKDLDDFCDACSANLCAQYGEFYYTVKDGSVTITAIADNSEGYIDIPDTIEGYPVTTIAEKAFCAHYGITGITIPAGVTTIGDDAFCGCRSLKKINVDANNACYASDEEGVLFNKNKTVLIQYPVGKNISSDLIPSGAYTIPDGVKSIEKSAFEDCHTLRSLTIPRSVTTIGENAFVGVYWLAYVYYEGTQEEWNRIEISEGNDCLNVEKFMFRGDFFPKPPNTKIVVNGDTMVITAGKGTLVEDIRNALHLNMTVTDKDGKPVAQNHKVGTGAKAVLISGDGSLLLSYDIVVPMDIDGNGEVTAADARLALRYSAKLDTLGDVFKAAADINGDANITAADARAILRVAAKLDAYKF